MSASMTAAARPILWGCCAVLMTVSLTAAAVPSERDLLAAARVAAAAGNDQAVIDALQEWLHATHGEEETAEAFFLIGQASWHLGEAADALFYLRKLIRDAPLSPRVADASFLLGQILVEQGAVREAIGQFEKAAGLRSDPAFRRQAYERLVGLYQQSGRLVKVIETLQRLQRIAEETQETELLVRANEQIVGAIQAEQDIGQLKRVVDGLPRRFPVDLALLRLADLAALRHEPYEEEQWLRRLLQDFPGHPKEREVTQRLDGMAEALRNRTAVIGVLLPLSGPAKSFGQRALRGVQVAWDEHMTGSPEEAGQLGLAIRDSQRRDGTHPQWVRDYHPLAVIGPLMSREIAQASELARQARVPFLSPGLSPGTLVGSGEEAELFEGGDPKSYLFQNGLTLAQQAQTIVDYAVRRLAALRFVIIAPKDTYARQLVEGFTETVRLLGGEIIATASYEVDATDFSQQIRAIKQVDLEHYGVIGPPIEGAPPEEWPYVPGFDAIFLPGDAKQAGMIASQLAFHGYEGMTLLGTGGWNQPELFTFGGRFVEGAVFVDGFFAGSESPAVKEFVRRYRMRYHEAPDLFAAQAYDAVMIALAAVKQGARTGTDVRDYLTGIQLYQGVSGLTSLVPGRPAAKQLFVLQVHEGKIIQVQ